MNSFWFIKLYKGTKEIVHDTKVHAMVRLGT